MDVKGYSLPSLSQHGACVLFALWVERIRAISSIPSKDQKRRASLRICFLSCGGCPV